MKESLVSKLQLLTSCFRLLPDFLIIGGMKCGTSSLYYNLMKHPNIGPAARKEIHFFTRYYQRGINWYRSHFPLALWKRLNKIRNQSFVTGEASAKYMLDIHTPKRVHKHLPGVKLIILLRNPVDRAFSHYKARRRTGKEPLSFEKALEKEEERVRCDFIKRCKNERRLAYKYWNFSYRAMGIYIEQLKRWSQYFKMEDMLILDSEEFARNTEGVYYQVLKFLNLSLWRPEEFGKVNVAADNLKMEERTRKYLVDYFKPHNERLYEWLGYRFDWDK